MFSQFSNLVSNISSQVSLTISDIVSSDSIAIEEAKLQQLAKQKQLISEAELQAKNNYYPAPPYRIFQEQYIILEPELQSRILALTNNNSIFIKNKNNNTNNTDNNNTNQSTNTDANIFVFDYNDAYFQIFARLALQFDSKLNKLRYELVPKYVNEVEFWRSYFYEVELLRFNMNLQSLFHKPTEQQTLFYKNYLNSKNKLQNNVESTKSNNENLFPLAQPVKSPTIKQSNNNKAITNNTSSDVSNANQISSSSLNNTITSNQANLHNTKSNNTSAINAKTPIVAENPSKKSENSNNNSDGNARSAADDLAELESLLADVTIENNPNNDTDTNANESNNLELIESELDLQLDELENNVNNPKSDLP
jgi:hypothetical protein